MPVVIIILFPGWWWGSGSEWGVKREELLMMLLKWIEDYNGIQLQCRIRMREKRTNCVDTSDQMDGAGGAGKTRPTLWGFD